VPSASNTVLWFSDLRGSTGNQREPWPGEIIPFLNDYAQASIDANPQCRRRGTEN